MGLTELLKVDGGAQLTALVIQGFGGLVLLFIAWLVKRVYNAVEKIYERLDHLDACVDAVKDEVKESKAERHRVSELEKQVAHMKGTMGVALHEELTA